MNWLAKLKETQKHPDSDPTKPTKAPFVGFVAPVEGVCAKNEALWPVAASDQPKAASANLQTHPVSQADEMHAARVDLFTRRGLRVKDAESLSAAVARRASDFDDRHACMECQHLSGKQCSRAAYAGAGRIVEALVRLPQRCPAFEGAL